MKWGGGCTDTTVRKKGRGMKKIFLLLLIFFTTESFATGIGNVATAPCDNDTLSKYTGTANVEINWEPNTINLNWYDGDTKLTVANSAQSCVYDSTLTVPQQPTKLGYTFNGWKVIRVPGGFTELQYLESTSSTQWINTNVVYEANDIYRVIADMQFTVVDRTQFFGIHAGAYFGIKESKWTLGSDGVTNPSGVTSVYADTNRHIFDLNTTIGSNKNIILKIDNDTYTSARNVSRGYAGIFNLPGRPDGWGCFAKLYGVKFYKNGNMVFNGVPARRNSDDVIGIYDTVTDTFFTNSGSGSFVAGPEEQQ